MLHWMDPKTEVKCILSSALGFIEQANARIFVGNPHLSEDNEVREHINRVTLAIEQLAKDCIRWSVGKNGAIEG